MVRLAEVLFCSSISSFSVVEDKTVMERFSESNIGCGMEIDLVVGVFEALLQPRKIRSVENKSVRNILFMIIHLHLVKRDGN